MLDDITRSAFDMQELKVICEDGGLEKCYMCRHAWPNAGYDAPYCYKLTEAGKGAKKGCLLKYNCDDYSIPDGSYPYKLVEGNIPKRCPHFEPSIPCSVTVID